MKIYNTHPTYLEFIKNEKKTLSFLFTNTFIADRLPKLASDAQLAYYDYNIQDKYLKDKTFSFQSDFDLVVEKAQRRIVVEALVAPDFSHVSYVLSICENCVDPFNVIRKFHFDYAVPIPNDPEPKPVYHYQYGGQQSPGLTALNLNVNNLYPWLSSPRLCYTPTNLALLLDMICCEFRSEITNGIAERSEWRNFIKQNEDDLLKPFYSQVRSFMDNHHKSTFLFRDYCYGN